MTLSVANTGVPVSHPGVDAAAFGGNPVFADTKPKILLFSLVALVVLLLQFLLRDLDNNRLLSWQWVMTQDALLKILLASVAGFIAVYHGCIAKLSANREILVLGAVSYVLGMATWTVPEFMVDTGRYFIHAKLIATHGLGYFLSQWGYGINAWTDMPLMSVIYGGLFYVFGESRLVIQIVNTGLFSGALIITCLIGKELWDEKTGVDAGWLLLAIPFLHVQASQMLVDVPAMFFTLAAILLSFIAIKKTGYGWVLLASAAIVFAVLTKYSVWIALIPIAVLPFALTGFDRRDVMKRLSLLALVTTVLMIFVFYVHHPVILKQLKILLDYQLPALQRWQESYISTFFYQTHPVVSLAALLSVYVAVRKKDVRYLVPASALAVALALGVFRARYLIIVFPLLALVSAFGLQQIRDIVVRRYVVYSAVVMSVAITMVANVNFLQTTSAINLKKTGEYLNSLNATEVAAIVLPQPATVVNPEIILPVLDYYSKMPLAQVNSTAFDASGSKTNTAVSPLRFTWDVDNHSYPGIDAEALKTYSALLVVSGTRTPSFSPELEKLLIDYMPKKTFAVADDVFRFQTIVTVYRHRSREMDQRSTYKR